MEGGRKEERERGVRGRERESDLLHLSEVAPVQTAKPG